MVIDIVCVDVEDAKKMIGNKAIFEGKEIELVDVRAHCAIVKHLDGTKQKILWHILLTSGMSPNCEALALGARIGAFDSHIPDQQKLK
jgi:hypothetical protein